MMPAVALGADRAQIFGTMEKGFARLVMTFPDRLDLPEYRLKYENGVIGIEFDESVDILLPDLAVQLAEYISIARVDPGSRGVRFGLRGKFNVNRLEAGERLFIDIMPSGWQGLPPGLPPEVVDELAQRAKTAAILAAQEQKAREAEALKPAVDIRVGRNPTFVRLQFEWNVETEAQFVLEEGLAHLDFDWPVPIATVDLEVSLPEELTGVTNGVTPDGSRLSFGLAEGVVPRFYAVSERQFVLDVDVAPETGIAAAIAEEQRKKQAELEALAKGEAPRGDSDPHLDLSDGSDVKEVYPSIVGPITPTISMAGATVRIGFPFEQDTAAAVFRRGNTLWLLFDTSVTINEPARNDILDSVVSKVAVSVAGTARIVRLDLSSERLATLGSEGRAWVLSLGDVLLGPTEPVAFRRMRDAEGRYEMLADLGHPARVHEFRDPDVGDVLTVVTVFPPARGLARNLRFVDFGALRSVHGLVVRPETEALEVGIVGSEVRIQSPGGLTLSAVDGPRVFDAANAAELRQSFVDLGAAREDDPGRMVKRREELISRAAETDGRLRDRARLDLAHFYIANQFSHEAIGVLKVMELQLKSEDLRKKLRLSRGIADILAARPKEGLAILNSEAFSEDVDALLWRTLAKVEIGDFKGARLDALSAEPVVESYPSWVRRRFLLAGIRAALETRDTDTAIRLLDRIEFAKLEPEEVTEYQLLQGRLAEEEQRYDDALDSYGQVIAAEVRPSRAEAVYRTLLVLDATGRIDLPKATETLSAEVMMWRGNVLEAEMQKFLARLYFRNGQFREGFSTVKEAVNTHAESESLNELLAESQGVFVDLFLNGRAETLEDVAALTLFYDFRELTPPGARGDEMIRNLARRLVKVDLLTQAADLLEYQIDTRLKGVAQAQIAADLAIIRIADRDPEGALRILGRTRLAALSPLLERQRRILEARALIDAGREELAIDLLNRVKGRDADLLRVDGYWKSKNYGTASELLEVTYSPGAEPLPLSQPDRMNIIKAAVGFVLTGDKLGLTRLRSKFGEQMAGSAEWPMFDFVTASEGPQSVEFREVAREVSGLDSLNAFLGVYREMYAAGDPMTPATASRRGDAA